MFSSKEMESTVGKSGYWSPGLCGTLHVYSACKLVPPSFQDVQTADQHESRRKLKGQMSKFFHHVRCQNFRDICGNGILCSIRRIHEVSSPQ